MARVETQPEAVGRRDDRLDSGRPPWLAPVVAGALGAAGLVYVRAVDPTRRGVFLVCPFHRVTGLWCPGCGMTRALHGLLTGDVAGALSSNLFAPLVVGLGGYLWLAWLWPAVTGRRLPNPARSAGLWTTLVVAALLYGLLRNLPFPPFSALAP